ncbi:MAG: ABC transporter permease, partial [Ruminiclostridium sp.]
AAFMSVMAETSTTMRDAPEHENDAVYEMSMMLSLFNNIFSHDVSTNNLTPFKKYIDEQLEDPESELSQYASTVQYSYKVSMKNYVKDENGEYRSTNLGDAFTSLGSTNASTSDNSKTSAVYSMMSTGLSNADLWGELIPGTNGELVSDAIKEQYELVYGQWPKKANEIVLILNKNNEISDIAFYSLGLISKDEINNIFAASMNGEDYERETQKVSYEDICNITFKMLLNTDFYTDSDNDGVWEYIGDDETQLDMRIKNGYDIKISGIVKTDADPSSSLMNSTFGYTKALTEYIINTVNDSEIVKAQRSDENANMNVISGLPFEITRENESTDSEKAKAVKEYFAGLTTAEKAELYKKMVSDPSEDYINQTLEVYMADYKTRSDIEDLIASTYGIDLEQAQSYLSSYTDEELTDLMKEQFTNVIKSQYASAAEDTIKAVSTAPSEEELAAFVAQITSQLTDNQTKIGYVAKSWNETTGMDIMTVMGYLAGVSQADLDGFVYSVAAADAAKMYSQFAGADEEKINEKLAAAFDSTYGSETDEKVLVGYYEKYMPSRVSDITCDEVLEKLGVLSLDSPSSINIYADTFENKDSIAGVIADYNETAIEDDKITYTDYIALLMSGITTIINAISFGLIAFVSISLVVSSIMIGIITYISVLERTKEIGILRAIGASKKDVKRVFNAETIIVGFTSGALGIIISLLLCIPINLIVHAVSGVTEINATLVPAACVILVAISMILTLIAGLIPASVAAKKDPVEALRSE